MRGRWDAIRTRRLKLVLLSLVAVGAIGSVSVRGVFAILSSQEENPAASVSSGTLTFDNSSSYGLTYLAASMTNGQTTVTVPSATGFPGSGSYTIQIDSEQMTVTAGQGTTTWTVTRGVNGTSAATHTVGAAIKLITTLSAAVGQTTLSGATAQTTLASSVGNTTLTADVGTTTLTQPFGLDALTSGTGSGIGTTTESTSLSNNCTSTTMTVAAVTNFPTSTQVPFNVQIGSEQMTVTSEGTSPFRTWSITRCVNGTSSAAHSNAQVNQISKVAVATPSAFPSSGNFTVVIGTEQLQVTGGQGTSSWTVTRGFNSTTIATHAGGAAVTQLTLTVNDASHFPGSNGFTVQIDSEVLTVTAGAGTTTWTVTRGTAASHANNAKVNANTLTVNSAANFPSTNGYTIQIDNEQMTVTAGAGSTNWTVTRAVNSTTAVTHTSTTKVHPVTITVASSSGFPAAPFPVQIDNEQLTVTNVAGTVWTVTRAANGTTASSHDNSAAVNIAQIGVSSATSFPSSGTYTVQIENEQMTVTAGQGTGTWTVKRGVNGTSASSHASGKTVNQVSLSVGSATGFPSSSAYTVRVDNEEMQVVGGQGTTTWTVVRAVDGTSIATHASGAAVAANTCDSIGGSSNVNTGCDSVVTYSPAGELSPGNSAIGTVTLTDNGSIKTSDLEVYMPSCLRGITPDAPFASSVPAAPTFSGASSSGGTLLGLTTYYYEITAVSASGESVAGAEASYLVPFGTNTNQVTLNWSAVAGATSYKVYRSDNGGGYGEGGEQLLASGISGTSYTDNTGASPSGWPPSGTGSGDPCGGETYFTGASTVLNGGISSGATTLTLSSASGFPTSGNYTIQIDSEQMTVTGGQGTTNLTVTRGANGTTPAAHSSSAVVIQESFPASQTTLTINSPAGFPSSGNFTIQVDSEQMTVTGGQGTTTWTVTRGANSTTAASHSIGSTAALTDNPELYIQETDSSGNAFQCWYPVSTTSCGTPNSSWIINALPEFAGSSNSQGQAWDLGAGPVALRTRYFQVGVTLPSSADNSLQGTEANFTLRWYAQQS